MTLFYKFIIIKVNVFIKIKEVCIIPKILQNVREQLIAEAGRQIAENGYKKTTVRSVAKACGLGVGTVYNYFNSKEMLIASFMADDWCRCLEFMQSVNSDSPKDVLKSICTTLTEFSRKHRTLFSDGDASTVFASVFNERHGQYLFSTPLAEHKAHGKSLRNRLLICIIGISPLPGTPPAP